MKNYGWTSWLRAASLLLACAVIARAQVERPPDALRPLLGVVDPERDDWEIEHLERDLVALLAEVRSFLKGAEWNEAIAVNGATGSACVAGTFGPTHEVRGFRYSELDVSNAPSVSLRSVMEGLRSHFGEGVERVSFKVIGLEVAASEALIRIEIVGGRKQLVGRCSVGLKVRGQESQPIRLSALSWVRLVLTQSAAPLFVERTDQVLPNDQALRRDLSRGATDHVGRSDTVGERIFMGHNGMAVGDVNGDGRPDLYVAMPNGLPNRLLIQATDGSVRDVAKESGVAWLDDSKGCLILDLDNDGDQDLAVAMGSVILIAWNDGKGGLNEYTSLRAPTSAVYYSLSATDYDADGNLDIYGVRYVSVRYGESIPLPLHDARNGPSNQLWRNNGKRVWTDVTGDVGLQIGNDRFSLSSSWADVDGDGDEDLYVANDFGRNLLYRNDDGRFVDITAESGVADQAAGMGVSFGDIDGDGDLDLHVTNMFSAAGRRVAYSRRFDRDDEVTLRDGVRRLSLGNSLFLNDGKGVFQDRSSDAGIGMGRWGWGAELIDINGDGLLDVVVPNGFLTGNEKDDL